MSSPDVIARLGSGPSQSARRPASPHRGAARARQRLGRPQQHRLPDGTTARPRQGGPERDGGGRRGGMRPGGTAGPPWRLGGIEPRPPPCPRVCAGFRSGVGRRAERYSGVMLPVLHDAAECRKGLGPSERQ